MISPRQAQTAKLSPRLAALRELAAAVLPAEVKAARPPLCVWCLRADVGDPIEIPKLSAPQCAEHLALNQERSRRINRAPIDYIDFRPLHAEIARRGLEIALRRSGVVWKTEAA